MCGVGMCECAFVHVCEVSCSLFPKLSRINWCEGGKDGVGTYTVPQKWGARETLYTSVISMKDGCRDEWSDGQHKNT